MSLLLPTTRDTYKTLHQAQVLSTADPDAIALIYLSVEQEPIHITRGMFQEAARGYANALHRLGVQPRDLVLIAHTQNLESIYAFWGAILLGAIPSMFPTLTEKLDPNIYMQRMAKLVAHSDVACIVTTDEFAPQLAPQVGCPVYGSKQLDRAMIDGWQPTDPAPDTIAFLQHSSGTTGLQKGVALSHQAVLNHLASYSEALSFNENEVIVSWLPLYHDMGLIAGFILPLVQGIPLVLMSPFEWVRQPAMLLRAIQTYQGTLCWLPNFAYNHMARRVRKRDLEGLDVSSIRAFVNCSEPVHEESHQAFAEKFAPYGVRREQLTVSYAMAENTFAVTQTAIGDYPALDHIDRAALEGARRAIPTDDDSEITQLVVSCGKPIRDVAVRVMDDDGRIVDDRHIGQLFVKSTFMLSGYYQRDDLNATLWQDGWYATGDMGYMVDGEVYIVGRKKDLIINGGKNVYPQDLEAIVNTVEGVHKGRAVAFGVYDERDGTELIGVVAEVHTDDAEHRQRIAGEIRQRIAQQTTVTASYVYLVDEKWLLKTSSGKIARAANRDKWLAERGH